MKTFVQEEPRVALDQELPADEQFPGRQAALYYSAIRAYLRAILHDDDIVEDELHNIVVKLLRGDLAGWQSEQGRFCDFLKTVVRNAALDALRRQKKRAGHRTNLDLNDEADEPSESVWWRVYRGAILHTAMNELRRYQETHPGNVFATLIDHLCDGGDADDSEQLARRLTHALGRKITSENARKLKERARRKFGDLLVAAVRAALDEPTPERVEAELAYLGLLPCVSQSHSS